MTREIARQVFIPLVEEWRKDHGQDAGPGSLE